MIEAGYELDALIAKHVMGLEPRTFADGCPICNGPLYDVGTRARCGNCGDWVYSPYLEYSSDIAAAWKVAEKLLPQWEMHISPTLTDTMVVCNPSPFVQEKQICIVAETAPLAICTAALHAVGVAAWREGTQVILPLAFPECPECGMTHAPGGNTLCSQ